MNPSLTSGTRIDFISLGISCSPFIHKQLKDKWLACNQQKFLLYRLEQVENLRQLFPHVPGTEVESALQAVNGDVDEAASVIMLRNSSGLLSMPVLAQSFSYSISFITG